MKRLLENVILLSAIKFCDMFIPLLIIPYVISVIGLNSYGVFAVCLTVFNFILTFNDFGLNTLLAKEVAQKNDKIWSRNYLVTCTNIKVILSFFSSLAFVLFAFVKGSDYVYVSLFFIMGAFFESISPVAYFQGIQQLRLASLFQFTCRLISALLVFVLVKQNNDLILYAFIHNISYVANCMLLLNLINKKHDINLRFKIIPFATFEKIFKEAWHIYSFRFISGLINPIITIFLSSFYGEQIVSIYSVSQRVCSAASRVYEPVNNAIFPHMATIVKTKFKIFLKQSIVYIFLLLISSSVVCFFLLMYQSQVQVYLIKRNFIGKELSIYFFAIVILIPSVINLYLNYMLIALNKASVIKINVFASVFILIVGLAFIASENLAPQYVATLLLISSGLLTIGLFFSIYVTIKKTTLI